MSDDLERTTRASDAERDEAASPGAHPAAAGRLTPAELDERVAAALVARTRGELAVLEADLPSGSSTAPRPADPADVRPGRRRSPGRTWSSWPPRGEFAAYLSVMALLVTIWALTGAGYFWPVWPALGWGVALIGPGGGRCGAGHRRRLSRRAAPRA
jgi:hypothetical protein